MVHEKIKVPCMLIKVEGTRQNIISSSRAGKRKKRLIKKNGITFSEVNPIMLREQKKVKASE